jgi:succinate-semialdehyde dehydrogenase/glutarate-semialdehyde dehydrogenase
MLINGEWVFASDNAVIDVINPATEEVFAQVPQATAEDVKRAVEATHRAFPAWARLSPFGRGEYLRKAIHLALQRVEDIAWTISEEEGKPLREAREEVEKAADILRYYAEEGERIYGRVVHNVDPSSYSTVIYQPKGPCAAIAPWNYPVELIAWKVGAALAAGCTVVAKPSVIAPLSPLLFLKCVADAGVPPGVINGVTGTGSVVGRELIDNPLVKKVAFTGSTAVGKTIMHEHAETLKSFSLELGSSCPLIVCEDCDLDAVFNGAVRRSFRNNGQVCIAINRIYVQESVYEEFIDRFVEATKKLTIGNPLVNVNCDLGPMATKDGLEKVKQHVEDALKRGAKLACGGKRPEGSEFEKGFWFEPTIIINVDHSALVMREETFGPVVGVMKFKSLDEAIRLANDAPYGLASYAYTNDFHKARRLAEELQSGNVAINNVDAGVINAPYGGWKDSGMGYEHGPEGLYEYLKAKHVRVSFYSAV